MGRRAKKQKVVTKKRATLAKRFKCPFCANEQVVECKMDFKAGVGSLECRLCGASYQMPIHHLHEPIDVFSEWLDDCDAAHQGRNPDNTNTMIPQDEEDDDDDDDLGMSSGLGRAPEAIEDNRKAPARPSAPERQPQSYSALGLDDSDDDDSD
jgi:transcription elongation factor Elf1